ncbi:hypothetical protein LXA47_30125 [Massilia sp. P8910]|uniref:Uncharacterized protein n=2 Tax=Massilia antarctica TaxID=2765360 RepID=A0AA49AAH7_9BURK|nr:hypothetical protein [Massilia antarctica]MCE3607826.1 hypothetical protein [Massilia antarctica]QPI51755.1 hypothetical protein IV454_09785 [Massilia antarctica]
MLITKWEIGKYHDGWSDGFHRIVLHVREVQTNFHFARATVERLDSGEQIGGVQKSGATPEQALDSVAASLEECVASCPRPPAEWGRLELRSLLVDYRKFNDELTSILVKLQKLRANGHLSESNLHDLYWQSRNFSVKNIATLTHRLAAMSDQDRIDLMTSPDEVYRNLADPCHLDDYDGRAALFEFIVNPSDEVLEAHEAHKARAMSPLSSDVQGPM